MTDASGDGGTPEEFAKHNARMKRVQAARARIQARRTKERGLLIVHTGNGKGKSSSAFGMAMRSLGWGMRVAIVQYVKGSWDTGEKRFFASHPGLLRFEVMGEGFTWDTQDRARDIAAARKAWALSLELLHDPAIDFLILDELHIVLRDATLLPDEVIAALAARPERLHVCTTGRGAPPGLIDIADLVTEFQEVKHPFKAGFKAQRGVEF